MAEPQVDGWEGILAPNERILWQGRPRGGLGFGPGALIALPFGLAFSGFALFWMVLASGAGGLFWMFGLIHFTAGLAVALGPILFPAWRRRHTWYTLTDRRAFIATDMPLRGRRLDSYDLRATTRLSLVPGPPATIHFATRSQRGRNGTRAVPVGFERIEDGDRVYRLMRDLRASSAESPPAHSTQTEQPTP